MKYLLIARDLFRDIVPFHRLAPDRARVVSGGAVQPGTQPLCLSSTEGDWVLAYLPSPPPSPCGWRARLTTASGST